MSAPRKLLIPARRAWRKQPVTVYKFAIALAASPGDGDNSFTTSYAYHLGPWQQTTPEGKKWLTDQLKRWNTRFIVAACPWHRHLFSGWLGSEPNFSKATNVRDLVLRYDGCVNSFKWPGSNWEEEPYISTP